MFVGIYEKAINIHFNWQEKIKMAKKAGFDFIEFSIDETTEKLKRLDWDDEKVNELKQILKDHNFYLNSMCFSALRKYPFGSKNLKIRKKAAEITKKAIILAKKLGIRSILLTGNEFYWKNQDKDIIQNLILSLKEVAKIANKYSIMLTLEPMECKTFGTISALKDIIDKVNSPWLKITLDLGNLYQFAKTNLQKEIIKGKSYFVGTQFKDSLSKKFRDISWGEGTVDFKKIVLYLKKINYTGPQTIEMWSKNRKEETFKNNLEELKKAKNFFDLQLID